MKLKSVFAVLLCGAMALSLFGCGTDAHSQLESLLESKTETETVTETMPEEVTEPEEEPKEEPETEPEEEPEAVPAAKVELTAEDVYDAVAPAVVELHVYDADGNYISLGSGFFIDADGTIATNYHVIEGGASITASNYDGDTYDIVSILAYDADLDLALIECEWHNPAYLTRSESAGRTGQTVYALGSSQGLTGTFSEGIISTASREVEGKNCIQITAPISSGNSGGPLVNTYGEVLGINSMVYVEGQNLNFAIKIAELDKLTLGGTVSLQDFNADTYADTAAASYDDPGMAVYDMADYREVESNDSLNEADLLGNGTYTAGLLDAANEDFDFFAVELTAGQTITVAYVNYYYEDDDYVMPALIDWNVDVLAYPEYDEDGWYYISYTAEADGYVFIAVMNFKDDYPYSGGAYYLVGASWS